MDINQFGLGSRIKDFRNAKNIQQNELAQRITLIANKNISAQYLAKIENEDIENPSYKFASWMLMLFPDINATWLLTGKGNMFAKTIKEELEEDLVCIKDFDTNENILLSKSILSRVFNVKTAKTELLLFKVTDNSMHPTLLKNEYVIIERTTNIRDNDIIVFRIEDRVFVRRLFVGPLDQVFTFISDNKKFPNIEATPKERSSLIIIGTVISKN